MRTTPQDNKKFEQLLGNGKKYGVNILYAIQKNPEGIGQAFIIGKDFITITKSSDVDWEVIKPNVFSKMLDFFSLNEEIKIAKSSKTKGPKKTYEKEELAIVKQINDLLDERIKPAVAQDGGDISFVKYEDGVVFLELRGACAGCPSSTITLKSGIENMLKYYIPEVVSVEAANQ